jgi:hypothetical protein
VVLTVGVVLEVPGVLRVRAAAWDLVVSLGLFSALLGWRVVPVALGASEAQVVLAPMEAWEAGVALEVQEVEAALMSLRLLLRRIF